MPDFFVSFGSNARKWADGLKGELSPAHTAIADLTARLKELQDTATAVAKGTEGKLSGVRLPGAAGEPELQAGSARIGMPDLERFVGHLGTLHDELDGVITKIKVAADATAQTAQSLRGAGSSMSRSAGGIRRHLEDPQPRATAGDANRAGTFARRDQPSLPGLEKYAGRGATPSSPAARPPETISGTPRALVDEAALSRVVTAIEQNVTATRAVESAIARLGGVQQGTNPEYERAFAEYQRASAEHARATQVAQQAARGREEQAARPAEAEQLATLQLAGSEDVLRRQSMDELRRIQGAYQEAGYEKQASTRAHANMEERQAAVRAAHQAYTEAAGVTKQGTGQEVRGETAREVRAAVDEVVTTVRRVLGGAASEILETGKQATHEELSDLAKTARAQGGLPGTTVESERGATHRYGDIQAELAKRGQQIPAAAVQQAMRLSQLPGFQPYDPHFQSRIRERAAEQQDPELRMEFGRAYASLTRAVDALDLIADEVVGQYRKVAAAEQRLASATTEAARKQAQQSLGREQQRLHAIPNWSQFLTPEFQRGKELRAPARAAQQEYYKTVAEAADLRKQTTVAPALFSALFNPAQVAGQTRQTLPGVRYTQYGSRARLGYASDYERTYSESGDEYEERDPKKLEQLRSRVSKLAKTLEAKFQASESEAGAAADEVERAWERVLRAYAEVFPEIGYLTGLKTRLDDVAAQVQAARTQPSQSSRTREGEAEVQAANVRLVEGAAPPEPPRPPVPPLPPGGVPFHGGRGGPDGSDRIVAAINALHNTVRSGLRAQPRATIRETPRGATATGRQPREPVERLAPRSVASPEARQQFIGTLPDDLQQLVRAAAQTKDAEAGVAAAVELVRRGFLTQRDALSLLRAEMDQSVATAKQFQTTVRTSLENANLLDPGRLGRAAARQQRQLKEQLGTIQTGADPYRQIREALTRFYAQQERQSRQQARAENQQRRQLRTQMSGITAPAGGAASSLTPNIDPEFVKNIRQQMIPFQQQARQAAREEALLATALGQVSQELQAEIADYRKADQAVIGHNQLIERQVRIYQQLKAQLSQQGLRTPDINAVASRALGTPQAPVGGKEIQQIARQANLQSSLEKQGQEAGGAFRRGMAGIFGDTGFWTRVVHSTGTFIVRNFSAGFVFGITNALQDALQQAIETEATFVRVSSSLEATGKSTAGLRSELQSISSDYGVALQDVYESTAGLVGLFDQPHELAGAARIVTQLQSISRGALNAQEATASLASITSSFGDLRNLEGLQHIADVLTVIQERAGVNIEVTAEGVARLSGLAQQVGLTFEQTAVFVAEIAKKTGQSGAAAGEQFSRIISVIQTGRGRGALVQALPGTGIEEALNAREYGDALTILMQRYGSLTKAQQDNIAITLGGQRQAAAVNALLAEGAKNLGLVQQAEDAKGQADQRSAELMKTLSGQLKIFQANIVSLAAALFRSGLGEFFGFILGAVNKLLGVTAQLISGFSDLADSTPLTHFLKNATVGMIGFAVAIALVRKAIGGLKAAIGVEAAAESGATAARRLPTAIQPDIQYNQQTGRYSAPIGPQVAPGTRTAGAGPGRIADFYNQRAAQTEARSQRLQEYAQRKSAAAEERAARFAQAGSSRTAARFSNAPTRALQASASGAAKAMGAVSTGLTGLASGGLAASAGLAAVTLAIGFLVSDLMRRAEESKKLEDAYQARFGGPKPVKPGDEDLPYVGPATDLFRQNKQRGAWDIRSAAIAKGYTDYFKSGAAAGVITPGGVKANFQMLQALFGGGELIKEQKGEIPKELQDRLNQQKDLARGQLQQAQPNTYVGMLLGKDTLAGNVKAAQEKSLRTLKEMAAEVRASKESTQTKEAALAQIEQAEKDLADMAKKMILVAQGLGDANALNDTQIQQVNQQLELYRGLEGRRPDEAYTNAIQQSIKEIGFSQGSTIRPLLEQMAKGGQTKGEEIAGEITAVQNNVNNYQAEYLALLSSGSADKQQIDEAFTKFVQAHSQLMQLYGEQVANLISEANLLATAFANRGEYGAAAAQIERAIAELRTKAAEPGLAKDKKAEYQNQIVQLGQQETDLAVQGQTRQLELARAQARDQGTSSNLEVRIALATLNARKAAFAQGKETQARVDDAQNQYTQALQGASDAAQQSVQAGYDLEAAGLMGNLARSRNAQAKALNQFAYAQKTYPKTSNEYKQALASVVSTGLAVEQALQEQAASALQLAAARTTDPVDRAVAEMRVAANNFRTVAAHNAAGTTEYNNALASLWQARLSIAQAEADERQSEFAVRAARALNAVSKAQIEAEAASAAYGDALRQGNRTATNQALAQQIQAQQAARQARQEQEAAARETKVTRIAPGDAVAIARQRLANARAAQQDARQFGTASTQYQQATQQVIDAVRAAQDAVDEVMKANYNLATALAEAAGRTVDAARLRYAEARKEWLIALRKSGGRQTADVKNAKATEVQAGAAYRDALLQDQLDTIDFNQQMGTLTSQGAIAALQKILKATNLTQQQRRDLMLKIKGLQDDLRSSLTSSGFNIPDEIKLPTPYEVRKSLGIDKYVKNFRPILNKAIGINAASTLSANTLSASASPTAVAPATASTSSNSVVAALDSVRQAVVANGAQVTNDIDITNQVSTPAMVEAVARRVVELISTSTAMGARANQASPKLVSY